MRQLHKQPHKQPHEQPHEKPREQWIDGHLDLAYIHLAGRDITTHDHNPLTGCIDLPALRKARINRIFATIFTDPVDNTADSPREPSSYTRNDPDDAFRAGVRQLNLYNTLAEQRELTITHDLDSFTHPPAQAPATNHPPHVVILMEGADPIRTPEDLPWWVERGVRIVGLTWALGTRYAGGNARPGPLTDLGRAMVDALDAHHVIHDLSHLADPAVDELLERAAGPVIASHSNARALHNNDDQRHLRDDHIRAIGARAGVIGLNLFAPFITADRPPTLDDAVRHIEHITNLMGHRRGVALGSDMDGGFPPSRLPESLNHPAKLEALADALRTRNWSDHDIAGFRTENWCRVLRTPTAHATLPNSPTPHSPPADPIAVPRPTMRP